MSRANALVLFPAIDLIIARKTKVKLLNIFSFTRMSSITIILKLVITRQQFIKSRRFFQNLEKEILIASSELGCCWS